MAAEKGRLMLLKGTTGVSPVTYVKIGGVRTRGLTINGEAVDITDSDSIDQWRELLANAGVKTASLSVSGVFKDSAGEEMLRGFADAQTLNSFEFSYESGDKWSGLFQVTTLENTGEYNGPRLFSATLEQSGKLTFTPQA